MIHSIHIVLLMTLCLRCFAALPPKYQTEEDLERINWQLEAIQTAPEQVDIFVLETSGALQVKLSDKQLLDYIEHGPNCHTRSLQTVKAMVTKIRQSESGLAKGDRIELSYIHFPTICMGPDRDNPSLLSLNQWYPAHLKCKNKKCELVAGQNSFSDLKDVEARQGVIVCDYIDSHPDVREFLLPAENIFSDILKENLQFFNICASVSDGKKLIVEAAVYGKRNYLMDHDPEKLMTLFDLAEKHAQAIRRYLLKQLHTPESMVSISDSPYIVVEDEKLKGKVRVRLYVE